MRQPHILIIKLIYEYYRPKLIHISKSYIAAFCIFAIFTDFRENKNIYLAIWAWGLFSVSLLQAMESGVILLFYYCIFTNVENAAFSSILQYIALLLWI